MAQPAPNLEALYASGVGVLERAVANKNSRQYKNDKKAGGSGFNEKARADQQARRDREKDGIEKGDPFYVNKRKKENAIRRKNYKKGDLYVNGCLKRKELAAPGSDAAKCAQGLADRGFYVAENFVADDSDEVRRLRAQSLEVTLTGLFQKFDRHGQGADGDGRRNMGFLPNGPVEWVFAFCAATLHRFMDADYIPLLPYILSSDANCEEQAPHADYIRAVSKWGARYPLSFILAIEPGTKFVYWENSTLHHHLEDLRSVKGVKRRVLELKVGDLLIWHGALVHAGAAYRKPNRRLFFYAVPPEIQGILHDGVSPVKAKK
eukprot:jgi/Mesvir1/18297/Mv02810-RA.1